ncbi:MAG TPA: M14 family zinc carboxypeptidase [Solirubrobacterales bacterium]|nr:M14 family zinc carboxypeptidase [Solirubrobacterales bacterium]
MSCGPRRRARRAAVEVVGHSNQGREIWSVRTGEGDTVMFIQGGIHGLEQHGAKAALNLMQTLGDDSARSREIRDALTVVLIPDLNPTTRRCPSART